ncbi:MAG: carbohydrate kinase family protein [Clostridiales bacterium]|nr:carbohydrate kinase family protein [Clostridiales bacterium]
MTNQSNNNAVGAAGAVDAPVVGGSVVVDIVGLGTPVMDQLVNLPQIPREEGAVRAHEVFHQGGGNAASAMAAAARLGARAGMLAKIGGDATGDFIIKDFRFNGVDTSRILRGGPETSSAYSIAISEVERGTRTFIIRAGNIGRMEPEEVPFDYIASAKVLHLEASGDPASLAAARFAREHGVLVSIDAGYYSKESEALLPYVDVFIASEFYYNDMFPGAGTSPEEYRKNMERVRAIGPSVVWVTLGARGCVGLVDGKYCEVPTFPVTVRDTTGAGDVFHGAYLAIMLEGLPHEECARHASAVSSIKCTYVGGRTGLPDRAMLARFLESGELPTAALEERLLYYRRSFLASGD